MDYRNSYRELRTDWLKLRGCLHDPGTHLPALPSVIDPVRRRLEAGERLGLIFFDPAGGGHLEAVWGWQAYDQLLEEVAEALRGVKAAHLAEPDVLAQAGVRSDEILLFVGLEGADDEAFPARLEEVRQALTEDVRGILAAHPAPESHTRPRLVSAAVPLRIDPTVRIERSIYRCLEEARIRCRHESERRKTGRLAELTRLIEERQVVTRYQPIVDLADGSVFGLEALSGPPSSEIFERGDLLFSFAEETDRIVELDRLCRREALRRARPLLGLGGRLPDSKLFLNCSAHVISDPELISDLVAGAGQLGIEPGDVVVEITERVAITEWKDFRKALRDLREAGLRIAIDDMGSGYSSLRAVAEIEPDFVKFDLSLILDIHRSPIKRDMVEALVLLAEKIGARPVAEGIEKREELVVLQTMGVGLGQGYFLATPAEPDELGPVHFPRD